MRIQAYTAFPFALTVTVATTRPQEAPSTMFTAGTVQEDYQAKVEALLQEYIHCGDASSCFPAVNRLQTYFPAFPTDSTKYLFALRELKPAGTSRHIDMDWHLEVMALRFEGLLVLLPAAWAASAELRSAKVRAIQYAVKKLFEAQTPPVPHVFIPSDQELRPGEGTTVDIVCEIGPGAARNGVDIPDPAGS